MKIRKATIKNKENYSRLREEYLKEYSKIIHKKIKISDILISKEFEEILSSPKRFLLIAEEDGKIKGYLIGTVLKNVWRKIGYIDDIFTLKDHRKEGIGNLLIKEFEKVMKKKKIKKYRLGVNIENKSAFKVYKKLGFKITHYEMEKKLK